MGHGAARSSRRSPPTNRPCSAVALGPARAPPRDASPIRGGPSTPEHQMADRGWTVAVRYRLGFVTLTVDDVLGVAIGMIAWAP